MEAITLCHNIYIYIYLFIYLRLDTTNSTIVRNYKLISVWRSPVIHTRVELFLKVTVLVLNFAYFVQFSIDGFVLSFKFEVGGFGDGIENSKP